MHVIDHGAGEPARGSSRNVLAESARISRGEIRDIATVATSELDGLIFPGGFGAAKNLSNFATDGGNCTVHPQVEKLVQDMNTAGKPLGFMCIAPAIAARSLGRLKPMLTIGNDEGTAAAITEMGATHVNCTVEEIVVDETHKIVSTPAYMLGPSIAPVSRGIHKLVEKVLDLA
jgi:enhancing lycopene biosynthesis protein 2